MNFDRLVELCQRTHRDIGGRAARSVDAYLVVRNWLFGRYIVEYEQRGEDRADYGAGFLQSLARRLSPLGIKGTGSTNLKLFRQFYLTTGRLSLPQASEVCDVTTRWRLARVRAT